MSISLPVPGDLIVTTYNELRLEVQGFLNRTDLDNRFASFVHKCESEMNRRFALKPVLPMHVVSTLTLASEYIDLPLSTMKIDEIDVPNEGPVLSTSPQNLAAMKAESPSGQTTPPAFYAQIGGKIRLHPVPQTSYSANLIYYEKIPQLTETSQTNWVIQDHSDAYLFGVLFYSRFYEDDPQLRDDCWAAFDAILNKILDAYPTQTDNAPLRVDVGLLNRSCFA